MRSIVTSLGLALASFALCAVPTTAQPAAERLAAARKNLGNVESALQTIESEKVLGVEAAQAFDSGLHTYAEGVFGAYTTLMSDAQLAGKSEGKQGNVDYMPSFEKELEVDHLRLAHVQEQVKSVQAGVQSGAILLDRTLLQSLSREELASFASYVSKDALAKYREAYPELEFPEWSLKAHVFPDGVGAFASNVYDQACAIPGKIDRAMMPPVEAALAWPCVGPCVAKQWGQCVTCVISAIPSGYEAWNAFVSCWNGSGKPWWVATWLWKTGCLLTFVARLA